MHPNVELFVKAMDEQNWVRLLVGFGPGLIIGKLANQIGSTSLSVASGVVLAAGMGVYLAWPMVRAKMAAPDEAETEALLVHTREAARPVERPAALASGATQAAAMASLVKLCGDRADRALELVNVELSVDPNQTYASALERALRRQELLERRT